MKPVKIIFQFIILTSVFIMGTNAQTVKNYESDWKSVETNLEKGLPTTALDLVKQIYKKARTDRQEAQVIKALVFMGLLQRENTEDSDVKFIQQLEKELTTSKEPAKSLLNSYLAGSYFSYFRNNSYKLYNRTQTTQYQKSDIATWGKNDFHSKISDLYLASIKNQALLQHTKLEPYNALIIKGNSRNLRPTLYDLLAQQALNYLKSSEREITRPLYRFQISGKGAFAPASEFVNERFDTKDTFSLQQKALLVYQDLIRFHLKDPNPDALIDVDLARIQYVYKNSVDPHKDQLYFNALKSIHEKFSDNPQAAQAGYLMASWLYEQGSKYEVGMDSTHQYDKLKAKELLDKILDNNTKSEGWTNAYNLHQQLLLPDFSLTIEKVNLPQSPFRALISYKNLSKIYLRAVPATEALKEAMETNRYIGKGWDQLAAAPPLRSWEQDLPKTTDLQTHLTEIKVEGLPAGEFLILASSKNSFSREENITASQLTYISNISIVNNDKDFFVLHRNTGEPLANAKVQVWQRNYNYNKNIYENIKYESFVSDKNGYFKLTPSKSKTPREVNNIFFEIAYGDEKLFIRDSQYNYYNLGPGSKEQEDSTILKSFLFTDRSLYRPGQTIYFKGIAIHTQRDGKKSSAATNYNTVVSLYDPNGQKVDSLAVTTNEYGSWHGQFVLPSTGLNGAYSLRTTGESNTPYLRVEEYKRPKFFVEFEKIKGSYQLNEEIKVPAMAKAYAGNAISSAKVKYRVVRQARFPYPWLFWRGWRPGETPQEIANGETETDDNGRFEISFKAIPDLQVSPKTEPVFDYKIYTDVTDLNGEVRSGEALVSVGYKSILLTAQVAERLPVDSLNQISVKTSNMAGSFEKAPIKITISKLKVEQRLLRPRYWSRPDQFTLSKTDYIKYFPNDIYDNEDNPQSWGVESVTLEQSTTTDTSGWVRLNNTKFAPGYYRVEISATDKNGQSITDRQFVELYDANQKTLIVPQYLFVKGPGPIDVGQKTSIEIGSSAEKLFLVQGASTPDTKFSFLKLDKELQTHIFTASDADRGGYGVSYLFVKNNRVFQSNNIISVPWSNKTLGIEYASFRDKTLPGAEENWTIKILGPQHEKVAAEMLASMYDASLDQFYPHQWQLPAIWYNFYQQKTWQATNNFKDERATILNNLQRVYQYFEKSYDQLFWINFYGVMSRTSRKDVWLSMSSKITKEILDAPSPAAMSDAVLKEDEPSYKSSVEYGDNKQVPTDSAQGEPEVKIRTNFNETAFFFPDLKTDKDGNISFSFTLPEALTRWKFQALAHTRDLAFGYSVKEMVTQKELMVQPNAPRFVREGDKFVFSSKIVNLSDKELNGVATLQLFNAATGDPVDLVFKNTASRKNFTIRAGQSQAVGFPVEIPDRFPEALTWRIIAKTNATNQSATLSDGEENTLPVLSNRMLVTETLPLAMQGAGSKKFVFEKLLNSGKSSTLSQQALTVEYTSNPAWYAVQALPYMMEYPYDCAEQTWNRYYANALASFMANISPKIKKIFENWQTEDTSALQSNLSRNQELKAVLLEETPWVLQAKSEAQQKKNIALLFDLVKMSNEKKGAYEKLLQMQSPNGGFVWFKGGPDDRFVTQYILTGIGHLQTLDRNLASQNDPLLTIVNNALPYLDRKIQEEYKDLIKYKINLKKYTPSYYVVQYLYMRSFFPERKLATNAQTVVNYFTERAQQTWVQQNKYMQAMIALALHRKGDAITPKAILKSLKETSVYNEELGRYYKEAAGSWWWYEAPIEKQALIIEAFEEVGGDTPTADEMRTWLLKNKQTNHWKSTKATAEAVYALLLRGTDWLETSQDVTIDLGGLKIESQLEKTQEATGYLKKVVPAEKVKPSMGEITVTISGPTGAQPSKKPSWGGIYWQYFENLDKITFAATPLSIQKKLFIETNTDGGPVLKPVNEGDRIKIGDKVKVRIELRVDRDMEYVHMKDMRASSFEPTNVLSSYKWQGGLGYYETTKDASTNFFFSYLSKGTYVFEYSLFATVAGNFSNGITSFQCMYAPEFTSHSEGVRVTVE